MSVNNQEIIRMSLGYNWLITQKTLQVISGYAWSPIKAFVTNNLFL